MGLHKQTGAGAPASTPTEVGQHYIDTTNDVSYMSVHTTDSTGWQKQSKDGHTHIKSEVTDFTHAIGSASHSADTLANLNSKVSDATLIDTADTRLSDSRTCDNTFDSAATSRTNLGVYSTSEVDGKVVGLYDHKGGYNASTNTPDLDTSPSGVLKGDMYTVTAAGTFFTIAVEIGDVLIAEIDSASAEADWTIINKNLDAASIKTSYESNADTNEYSDAEQSKLAAIEASATADQTGAEIKSAYEGESDTNAFTDAKSTKLDGIATSATANDTDANLKARANHTGTQLASTISDLPKAKNDATTAPTTTDDTGSGYSAGSQWVDVTNDKAYVCLDATSSAAVWTETTQSGGGSSPTIVCKTTDETLVSSETLQDDNDLKISILSGETWQFEFMVLTSEDVSNPNIKMRLAAAGGLTGTIHYYWEKRASSTNGLIANFTDDTGVITLTTSISHIMIKGVVTATANGTLQLQWAQSTSDSDATRVHTMSNVIAHKW